MRAPADHPELSVAGYLSLDTIVCPAGRFRDVPGGAALYAALGACAAGGVRVRLVARRGADFPDAVLESAARLGVDHAAVERASGASRRARLHDPRARTTSATRRESPHHEDDEWWARTRALAPSSQRLRGDAVVLTAMPASVLAAHISAARALGACIVVDTSEAFARHEREAILALLADVDVFAPSLEELRLLLPAPSTDRVVERLLERCPRLLEKRGPRGLRWHERGEPRLDAPSQASGVVDTTGAGDAAVGAVAAALARGKPPAEALRIAAGVAARAVQGIGPLGLGLAVPVEEVA